MFLQSFSANLHGRDFVIGDLHGMYDLLMDALSEVNFNPELDRCFSCGDIIDRGPDSENCLSLLNEPWFHPVRGNHEDILIEVTRNPSSAFMADWVLNGGQWHINISTRKMSAYANQLEELPALIEVTLPDGRHVAICHAEYPLDEWNPIRISDSPELTHAMQWSRKKIRQDDDTRVIGIDRIYCGHTIVEQPVTLGNTHFIDTGAFSNGLLTLISLTES